ncbi:MAG: LacI family DNA-binding transcriptional regulator [Roseibium sp.]|uniref:LacI family DNA-binding transcriptional regulator n=1 Tax=Roseibium sp. TaxID=1936156 RepID=UPI001B149CEF|nr:LacI family DNA-binding transcriptional regulator [Roseibium sp.]MBO6892530.1 LacI family DNA-binding transcriptional regulator [Roseibium sp.]MBO6932493.1 LacI family DNA-binding transcriptional regulator [Roseibium sp.]
MVRKKPTLKTVAEKTGLAVTTVSRALLDSPQIALETRKRVAEAARELGYIPDRAAQRLRTGRTKVISLILDPHNEIPDFGRSMVAGLSYALKGTGYHLTITPDFEGEPTIDPVNYITRNHLADGLIFTRTEYFDERVKLLQELGFPFVTHGRTELATPHAYWDYDNEEFAYRAARHLIDRGCQEIGIVLPPDRFTFYQHLRYGFMRAVRESGVASVIPVDIDLDSPPEVLREHFADWQLKPGTPTGIVCPGETSALAISSSLTDRRLTPGTDFHLAVKRTSSLFELHRPSYFSIYENIFESGRGLGHSILNLLEGGEVSNNQTIQAPVM